jgi:LAGLIDADG DNA endonuclease family protein
VTVEDLKWCVGLFEGEGCIGRHVSSSYSYVRLQLKMTDEDVVRKFCSILGVGKVFGPYKQGDRKPTWQWAVQGQKAADLLYAMLPHLGQRRTAAAREVLHV